MPTRRLVVALAVLVFGVFGVGLVTALGRTGDDGSKPRAQGDVGTGQPPFTTTPPATGDPVMPPSTATPTTPPPSADGTGDEGTDDSSDDSGEGSGDGSGDDSGDDSSDGSGSGSGDGSGNGSGEGGSDGGSGGHAAPNMPNTGAPAALAIAAATTLAAALRVRRLTR